MPQDFRSQRHPAEGIGFHELRQACEISALREDLERVLSEAGDLRGHIEESVEQVRTRFAALTPEELADSATMAPLLQFAVSQLIAIRDQARALRLESGPRPDEARPSWAAAYAPLRPSLVTSPRPEAPDPAPEPPPRPAPLQAAPPPRAEHTPVPLPLRAEAPPPPAPAAPGPPEPPQAPAGGWLMPSAGAAPRRPAEPRREPPPGFVDWLRPARR